jgi:hypothetical protein
MVEILSYNFTGFLVTLSFILLVDVVSAFAILVVGANAKIVAGILRVKFDRQAG